jgi:hypothetical protein
MRFMMLMHPHKAADANWTPTAEAVAEMGRYNDELSKAGILLALDGLAAPETATRVRFSGGKGTVVDGPYAEAKEVVGGYWMIQARSQDEAVEWASRCPAWDGDVIEVRQVMELSDFPEDVQAAARAAGES